MERTQLFIDTADVSEIEYWRSIGLVDGVTTNPALIARTGVPAQRQLERILESSDVPVCAQVTALESRTIVDEALELTSLSERVIVKVPATEAGYFAVKELVGKDVPCNVTQVFQPLQVLPFARLDVRFVSLILGQQEDFHGLDPEGAVHDAKLAISSCDSRTQLLAASIRNPQQFFAALRGGADVVTVPPSTWRGIFAHPETEQVVRAFHATTLERK